MTAPYISGRRWAGLVVPLCLALLAPVAAADPWGDTTKRCLKALRGYDVVAWEQALAELNGQDHPAAIALVLAFYDRHLKRDKPWTHPDLGALDNLAAGEPTERWYVQRLPDFKNPRSVRYAFDRLRGKSEPVAELVAWALKGRPLLHIVDDDLRAQFRKALRRKNAALAARYLELLKGRFHVGDRDWVEKEGRMIMARLPALPTPVPPNATDLIRDRLRRSYPDVGFRIEEAKAISEALGQPTNDMLTETPNQAQALHARLDAEAMIPKTFQLSAYLALHALDSLWPEVIREAFRLRVRKVMAMDCLADLDGVHQARVIRDHQRMTRHDLYFHALKQKQSFDRQAGRMRRQAELAEVDFGAPGLAREIRILGALRSWLEKRAPGRFLLGTPYHPQLLTLNQGRRGDYEDIVFTPRAAAERTLREEVTKHNAHLVGVRPLERVNAVLVNRYRDDHGLRPLRIDLDLCLAARRHSGYQRGRGAIAHVFHDAKEPHGRTPSQRMQKAGYPAGYAGGENVFMGSADPRVAFQGWRGSPPHRANMLNRSWREIGVGAVGRFWTQNFGIEPYDQDHDADPDE